MTLQVLVSTIHQIDHSLLEKMNIQSDAIIVNQCDRNEFEELEFKGHNIKFLSFAERGVGLSRNTALMRATADICLFADDDVTYIDNYEEHIEIAFLNNPEADVIIFNVPSTNTERPSFIIQKTRKVRWYNFLKFGAVRIAVKTEKLKQANIYFSLLFGGGAKYSCGEDSLFIGECLKKGLNIYTCPTIIGYGDQKGSTWFTGYNNKYFIDKGILYAFISRRWAKLLCFQYVVRRQKLFKSDKKVREAYRLMVKGIDQVKEKKG